MGALADDERGVSEATGVAILVGMTIVVTATVGLNVLVVTEEDDGPPSAEFSYDHVESSSALLITHVRGDEFPAGDLVIAGPRAETTWAAVSGVNETTVVGPGSVAQISKGNEYGRPVSKSTTVHVYYEREGNRTELSQWP